MPSGNHWPDSCKNHMLHKNIRRDKFRIEQVLSYGKPFSMVVFIRLVELWNSLLIVTLAVVTTAV